ncbi:MAG: phosphatase PAP2 family protein [Firmicutes bacterium]|nr:phosphatase PAP2 family protein [Alicyclobacillaceae bacterium]MCL6496979.1 phosphatase PAP2 family protein [Bacillota bacterium]
MFSIDRHGALALNQLGLHHHLVGSVAALLAKYSPEIWAVVFLLLWFWPPRVQNRARRAVVYAVVAGVLALVVNAVLGHLLPYRPRPFVALPGLIHPLLRHAADTSFPSDHAAGSFAFAVALAFAGAQDFLWGLLLAAAVAWARVVTGLHWPTDVLAGALVGIASGLFVLAIRARLEGLVRVLFGLFRIQGGKRYRFRR